MRVLQVSAPLIMKNFSFSKRKFVIKNLNLSLSKFLNTVAAETETRINQGLKNDSKVPQRHIPVMVNEVLNFMQPKDGQVFVDFTFGAGGHSKSILNANHNVSLYGLDRDPVAHNYALKIADEYGGRLIPLLGRFSELPQLLNEQGVEENSVDGMILDAGCSSMQFESPDRGFALSSDAPLDMRMDGDRFPNQATAADVVNSLDAIDLAKIFKTYGEEKKSKKIAQAIIDARYMMMEIRTTKQLANLVATIYGNDYNLTDKLNRFSHPATKVFQALRIFVNNEMNELNYAMDIAAKYLKPGTGKLAILTFHSLEDRIVKRHVMGVDIEAPKMYSFKYHNSAKVHTQEELNEIIKPKLWKQLHKHVITPSEEEVIMNPRSRSAKLRLTIKL